jgi:hypothetical protein
MMGRAGPEPRPGPRDRRRPLEPPPLRPRPLGGCCAEYPHRCPGCGRVMSHREAAEQGACNECLGGWAP